MGDTDERPVPLLPEEPRIILPRKLTKEERENLEDPYRGDKITMVVLFALFVLSCLMLYVVANGMNPVDLNQRNKAVQGIGR